MPQITQPCAPLDSEVVNFFTDPKARGDTRWALNRSQTAIWGGRGFIEPFPYLNISVFIYALELSINYGIMAEEFFIW